MDFDLSPAPYPGLRTFEQSESDIFFGRDDLVGEMLKKLEESHFLCVTGTSGSGKSSLVRTGLFNALLAGYLPGYGSDWVVCAMKPGDNPLKRMVDELASAVLRDPYAEEEDAEGDPERIAQLQTEFATYIDEVSSDLNPALDAVPEIGDRPVIILADQFEEVHRYPQSDRHATARFVDVLLKTAQAAGRVFVVITVRHEELAHCARFPGLNEAINASQFLTPALDRYQLQEAIEGPIRLFGGEIDPRLTVRILNDLETEMDKLPLMQHALKLLYERLKHREPLVIGVKDFNEVFELTPAQGFNGTSSRNALRAAMSNRLDRIYERLPDNLRAVTPRAFSALTNMGSQGRDIRNPVRLKALAKIIGLPVDKTVDLVEAFTEGEDGYLRASGPLNAETDPEIDVRHECVLRLWKRLQDEWLPDEAKNAQMFKDLARRARGWQGSKSLLLKLGDDRLLRGSELRQYQGWWKAQKPTKAWGRRYLSEVNAEGKTRAQTQDGGADDVDFEYTKRFLYASRNRRELASALAVVMSLVALFTVGWVLVQTEKARTDAAEKEAQIAQLATRAAQQEAEAAERTAKAEALRVVDAIVPGQSDKSPANTVLNAVRAIDSVTKLKVDPSDVRRAMNKLWEASFYVYERERYQHPPNLPGDVYAAGFIAGNERVVTLTRDLTLRQWRRGSTAAPLSEMNVIEVLDLHPDEQGRALRIAPNGYVAAFATNVGNIAFVDLSSSEMRVRKAVEPRTVRGGSVVDLSFSGNGRYLAAASYGGKAVRLFLRGTEGPLDWVAFGEPMVFNSEVFAVALNAAGDTLAIGLRNGQVCLAEPLQRSVPAICSGDGHLPGYAVKAVAFRPGTDTLVSAGNDDRAVIWNVKQLRQASATGNGPRLPGSHAVYTGVNLWHDSDVWDIAFDPTGEKMATIAWDGSIRLYNARNWKPLGLMRRHFQSARTVVFDQAGQNLLSAALDNTARIWSPFASLAASEHYSFRFASAEASGVPRSIVALAFGPEAEWLALTDASQVLLKSPTGNPRVLVAQRSYGAEPAVFVRLATGRSDVHADIIAATMQSEELRLWTRAADAPSFRESRMTFDFGGAGDRWLARRPVALSPDGTRLAVGLRSEDSYSVAVCPVPDTPGRAFCRSGARDVVQIRLPKLSDDAMTDGCKFQAPRPNALDFSPDGTQLAVGMQDCTVRLLDAWDGDAAQKTLFGHIGSVITVNYGSDGSVLAGSSDQTARFWPPRSDTSVQFFGEHSSLVNSVHLAPGSQTGVTVSSDEWLVLWNAQTGDLRSRLPGHDSTILALDMATTADGQVLMATGTSGGNLLVMPFFEEPTKLQAYIREKLVPILGEERVKATEDEAAAGDDSEGEDGR